MELGFFVMKYLPHRAPQLILPDGGIIAMDAGSCKDLGTTYQSQREIYEEMRQYLERVDKAMKSYKERTAHQFRSVDGICRNCGLSRARYEFSKPKPLCGQSGGSKHGRRDVQDSDRI